MAKTRIWISSIVSAALCVMIAALLAACGSGGVSSSSSEKLEANDTQASNSDTGGIRNILVIGDDTWEGSTPHADLMCLLRVDLDKHKLYEISIPRDTKCYFPDGTANKLLLMLSAEGVEAQVKAASDIVQTPIDHYVKINLDTFEKVVDHFGGVDVDLPYGVGYSFYTKDFPDEYYDAGEQTLTGWRAMALARARKGYGDIGLDDQEMIRQFVDRQMLTRLIQAAYAGGTDGLEALFTLFQDGIETDIPLADQVAWAQELGSKGSFEVIGTTGPFRGDTDGETGLWLVLPDEQGWANLMEAVESDGDIWAATDTYNYSVFPAATPPVTTTTVEVG